MAVVEHFGERVMSGKYGFRLTRETYAVVNKRSSTYTRREDLGEELGEYLSPIYEDEDHRILTDEWCEAQRQDALENFDLNMAFFAQIEPEAFETCLQAMLAGEKGLRPVFDLRKLDNVRGLYVMVLDEYRPAYVGQAWDIRKRIKQHWTKTKQFDRLLWGHKHKSVLSVDSFRALDTTRIFAMGTTRGFELEKRLVEGFPADYLLNRIAGGEMTQTRAAFIAAEVKRRNLAPDVETAAEA